MIERHDCNAIAEESKILIEGIVENIELIAHFHEEDSTTFSKITLRRHESWVRDCEVVRISTNIDWSSIVARPIVRKFAAINHNWCAFAVYLDRWTKIRRCILENALCYADISHCIKWNNLRVILLILFTHCFISFESDIINDSNSRMWRIVPHYQLRRVVVSIRFWVHPE